MGTKTKIDWCDSSWNPVTGCLRGCEYCYARRIAERFGSSDKISAAFNNNPQTNTMFFRDESEERHTVELPYNSRISIGTMSGFYQKPCELGAAVRIDGKAVPYPFDFTPTLHRYKLDEPQHWKKPRTVFVCSMADLFGEWVPNEWIEAVFDACEKAPQHRYLFLTKNPKRLKKLELEGKLPKRHWYGTSVTHKFDTEFWSPNYHTFASIEPMLESFSDENHKAYRQMIPQWVILGAETGKRKNMVIPQKEWITELMEYYRQYGYTKFFMKESLRNIMGDDFIQEFPWEGER